MDGHDPTQIHCPTPTDGQSAPLTSTRPARPARHDVDAALYEAGVIVEILRDMAEADIGGARTIQGPSIDYLARRLRAALDVIDPALAACEMD